MHGGDRWFPFRKSNAAAKVRLLCLPPAGGGATLYRSWQAHMPASIEVWPVQLPGRETRIGEKPIAEMTALVRELTTAVAPHVADTRYAIFGHSMGGLVAFELARSLKRLGRPLPVRLFVSGVGAPHHADPDNYRLLGDRELLERLDADGGYPREVLESRELMELLLPIVRADSAVTETYVNEADHALGCPITALFGIDDKKIPCRNVQDWRAYAPPASYDERGFPGGHDFLKTQSVEVARFVASSLATETDRNVA